jgi:hypothetical protein
MASGSGKPMPTLMLVVSSTRDDGHILMDTNKKSWAQAVYQLVDGGKQAVDAAVAGRKTLSVLVHTLFLGTAGLASRCCALR